MLLVPDLVALAGNRPGAGRGIAGYRTDRVLYIQGFLLPQGDIEVMETIVLVNHGERVSWGIERLLPVGGNRPGAEQALAYEILEVLVDGAPPTALSIRQRDWR